MTRVLRNSEAPTSDNLTQEETTGPETNDEERDEERKVLEASHSAGHDCLSYAQTDDRGLNTHIEKADRRLITGAQ